MEHKYETIDTYTQVTTKGKTHTFIPTTPIIDQTKIMDSVVKFAVECSNRDKWYYKVYNYHVSLEIDSQETEYATENIHQRFNEYEVITTVYNVVVHVYLQKEAVKHES